VIIVDPRRGSGELFAALSKKTECALDTLDAGDFSFEGYTESGRGLVGIELKKVSEFLDSMLTGRFSGSQLLGMTDVFHSLHLIVEGLWRPQAGTGLLETWGNGKNGGQWWVAKKGNRTLFYKEMSHFLMTLKMKTPLHVWRSSSQGETVQLIADLYSWFEKPWNAHTSHLTLYSGPKPGQRATFRKPPLRRLVACELPGISFQRSQALQEKFPTTLELINASKDELMEVDGIGPDTAEKVFNRIREE